MAVDAATADAAQEPGRTAVGSEPWTALAAWAADELGVRVAFDGKRYRLEEVESDETGDPAASESSIRRSWFRRRQAKQPAEEAEAPEPFTTEAPADVLAELVERLSERPQPPFARPVNQPTAVHNLSARLFDAYTLDGGQAHLAGCHFDDVPLVRLTWLEENEDETQSISHRFFDELGEAIDWTQATALGVDRVAPAAEPAPRIDGGRLQRMTESARRGAAADPENLITIVWAKRATGRLRFEFGARSVDTEFGGWARTLAAPPIVCPQTGVETYHLATIEGGEIAAAEQIAECVVTGHRRLLRDLVRCSATGVLAEPEHIGVCAATGEPVLKSELVKCTRCGLRVAPAARRGADCDGCHKTHRVSNDDPRMQAALAARPKLAAHKWTLAETPTAYVLESSGWLRRRVVTLDRESLAVLHAAEASRMSSTWRPVSVDAF